MAVGNINELPENILLERFTLTHARARPPAAAALPPGLQPLARPHRPCDPLETQVPTGGLHHRGLGPACGRLEDLLLPTKSPQESPAQPMC